MSVSVATASRHISPKALSFFTSVSRWIEPILARALVLRLHGTLTLRRAVSAASLWDDGRLNLFLAHGVGFRRMHP